MLLVEVTCTARRVHLMLPNNDMLIIIKIFRLCNGHTAQILMLLLHLVVIESGFVDLGGQLLNLGVVRPGFRAGEGLNQDGLCSFLGITLVA